MAGRPPSSTRVLDNPGSVLALRTIRTSDYTYPGLFVPWTIRTMDYLYVGLFVQWTFRTMDYSYYGLFVSFTNITYADKFFWAALWTWVLR